MDIEPQYTEEELNTTDKTVPNVEGLAKSEVAKAFDGSGLRYNFIGSGDEIVNQVPKGGSTLPEGSTVALYTEKDQQEEVVVPDVIGMTSTEANILLTNSGLNMKISGASATDQGAATVATQIPEAGATVSRGSAVTVEFSFANVH